MRITVVGHNPPGCACRPPGTAGYTGIHVGIQRGRDVVELHCGDEPAPRWVLDIEWRRARSGAMEPAGPFVQGKPNERFIYLSWVAEDGHGGRAMFRRAKLMFADVPPDLLDGRDLEAFVDLSLGDGTPRCARVRPPAIAWRAAGSNE
jgi:hypothetical protein